jgi:hypothetical protein
MRGCVEGMVDDAVDSAVIGGDTYSCNPALA